MLREEIEKHQNKTNKIKEKRIQSTRGRLLARTKRNFSQSTSDAEFQLMRQYDFGNMCVDEMIKFADEYEQTKITENKNKRNEDSLRKNTDFKLKLAGRLCPPETRLKYFSNNYIHTFVCVHSAEFPYGGNWRDATFKELSEIFKDYSKNTLLNSGEIIPQKIEYKNHFLIFNSLGSDDLCLNLGLIHFLSLMLPHTYFSIYIPLIKSKPMWLRDGRWIENYKITHFNFGLNLDFLGLGNDLKYAVLTPDKRKSGKVSGTLTRELNKKKKANKKSENFYNANKKALNNLKEKHLKIINYIQSAAMDFMTDYEPDSLEPEDVVKSQLKEFFNKDNVFKCNYLDEGKHTCIINIKDGISIRERNKNHNTEFDRKWPYFYSVAEEVLSEGTELNAFGTSEELCGEESEPNGFGAFEKKPAPVADANSTISSVIPLEEKSNISQEYNESVSNSEALFLNNNKNNKQEKEEAVLTDEEKLLQYQMDQEAKRWEEEMKKYNKK